MNIAELYSTSVYEVLGEDTQKYTSTSVSGGGGYVAGSGGTAYGQSAPVTSTTHYHSDQDVWVRDLETGNERKFEFNSFNVDVRPGHRIICAWNNESEKLERIVNVDTDTKHTGGGVYNDWSGVGKSLSESRGPFWASLLRFSWWPAIPFFSAWHALFALFKYCLAGTGPYWVEKAPGIRRNGLLLLITDGVLLLWAIMLANQWHVGMEEWIFYMMIAVIPLTIFHMNIIKAEFKVVKAHSNALDDYLNGYIAANRSTLFAEK